jgi:hypothetical protein
MGPLHYLVVLACIQMIDDFAGQSNPEKETQRIGSRLLETGSLPPGEFEEFVRWSLLNFKSRLVRSLENYLRLPGNLPDFLSVDLENALQSLQEAMVRPDYSVPADLAESRSLKEARHLSRTIVQQYGRLLQWWPEMREAAMTLRDKGESLAQIIQK